MQYEKRMTAEFDFCDQRQIMPLIRDLAIERRIRFGSCLDVGCGLRPCNRWFEKFSYACKPRRFLGCEVDEEMIAQLKSAGVDCVKPGETNRDIRSDLVLAIEVIEHLRAGESVNFLEFCREQTSKVFALTTPNFEYWTAALREEYKECRWIPDHFRYLKPASNNPHDHKQEMTPESLSEYFLKVFSAEEWNWRIYRAWPWEIRDMAVGRAFQLYFKLFALVWKKNLEIENVHA